MKNAGLTAAGVLRKAGIACSRLGAAAVLLFLGATGGASAGSLIAAWNPNTEEDLAGYIVYYGTESGKYSVEKDVGNTTLFVADNLTDGVRYYFVVKAYDRAGNVSGPSAEVSGVPGRPMLAAMRQKDGVKLVWTRIPDAESYQIFKGSDPYVVPSAPAATVSASVLEYLDTQYVSADERESYYTVRAVKAGQSIHTFERVGAYDMQLRSGLNLVSLPLVPQDSTVQSVFGNQLAGGESSQTGTQIRLWKGDQYDIIWRYQGPAAPEGKWINAATGLESASRIDPISAFWIRLQKGQPDCRVTVTGLVPTDSSRKITLAKGFNFVGSCWPKAVSLKSSKLYQDGVMKGGVGSGSSDIVRAWADSAYVSAWVVDGTGTPLDGTWMDESGKKETAIQFRPGEGYVIWIKGDRTNKVWTYPNPAFIKP